MTPTLQALREMFERSTKGEWNQRGYRGYTIGSKETDSYVATLAGTGHRRHANAALIVALHNAFPALCARMEALEKVVEAAREAITIQDEETRARFKNQQLQAALDAAAKGEK